MAKFYEAGYYLVHGVPTPECMSDVVRDPLLWTITDCICDLVPSFQLFPNSCLKRKDFNFIASRLGVSIDVIDRIRQDIDTMLSANQLGWPDVFLSLDFARSFYWKHLSTVNNFKLFGISLPEQFLEGFLEDEAPDEGRQGIGLYRVLTKRLEMSSDDGRLGFEILGLESDGSFHSFLCNGLQSNFMNILGVQFSNAGRIQRLDDAFKANEYINDELVGAEPIPWYPWLVTEYSLTDK